jgi:tRNA A37 threonylcarbamoyladenosine synthetase subunit TsaC/SUA5/YrdC
MKSTNIYLTPTDTTIGFVSQSADRLTTIKHRPPHKHYIKALPTLKQLRTFTRIPEKYKNRVRRSHRTSFVFPNGHSYRVIRDTSHTQLLKKIAWVYTTSANLSGEEYDEAFAKESADVLVGFPKEGPSARASKIYKLGINSIKRIR